MDRTAALQAAHQAQAKLREAEEAIATASAVLQGWCSDRIRDPPNTVMGQVRRALVPDPSQLSQEMQFGIPGGSAWGSLGATAPVMPASVPWSTPEWGVWWSRFIDHTASWVAPRTNHTVHTALVPSGPVHTEIVNDLAAVTRELNTIHHHTRLLHTHTDTLVAQTRLVVDECWPSAKTRLDAIERRETDIADITPSLTRLHSLDATKERLVVALQVAVETNNAYEQDQINRSLRDNKAQLSSTLEDIYQTYEGLSAGTSRAKYINLDLSTYINTSIEYENIDGIAIIDAIVKHVSDHIGDFPTIYPDIKLMWADFDPHTGMFWSPTLPDFSDPRRKRYVSESALLHSRISTALGADIMSRIVEVGIPFGRTNTKAIVVPSDSKDGITLLNT